MVGWSLTAADVPETGGSDTSIIVALIAALGTVLVALIGLAAQWISRASRIADPPPAVDPKLNERLAVTEATVNDDRRTLSQLDRYVDGIGDQVDKIRWEFDDLKARYETHHRKHHGE